ncbi:hypothetical protein ZWY2020_046665 [Hordeum vulgare]|nr:hypothetical protein ZWY2020_046665 [Hordeum vulgare]
MLERIYEQGKEGRRRRRWSGGLQAGVGGDHGGREEGIVRAWGEAESRQKSNRATILSALRQTGLRLMHQQHNSMFTCSLELILAHHHSMASNLMAQQLPLALAMTTITNSSNPNNNSLPLELLCLLVLAGGAGQASSGQQASTPATGGQLGYPNQAPILVLLHQAKRRKVLPLNMDTLLHRHSLSMICSHHHWARMARVLMGSLCMLRSRLHLLRMDRHTQAGYGQQTRSGPQYYFSFSKIQGIIIFRNIERFKDAQGMTRTIEDFVEQEDKDRRITAYSLLDSTAGTNLMMNITIFLRRCACPGSSVLNRKKMF